MARNADAIIQEISQLYEALDGVRAQRSASKGVGAEGGTPLPRDGDAPPRIILASRKLPFELKRAAGAAHWRGTSPADQETDQIIANLQAVFSKGHRATWVGWPRCYVGAQDQTVLTEQLTKRSYYPVWLEETKQYQFYNGFCKTVLWPLFHSLPPTTEDTISISRSEHIWNTGARDGASGGVFDESTMWQAYVHVNQRFADRIRDVYEDGDLVWIHDYHLMLVPQMLRALLPHAKIGFFLHVAFPSSELYRILPYREEILRGMLAADLLGFQTYQYARYFFQTCESILGLDWSPVAVEDAGHYANVCIIPIGISPTTYSLQCRSRPVDKLVKRYEKQFAGKKIILGVDSLDVTKGLVHKLLAIEEFLNTDCDIVNSVVFVQVAFSGAANANAASTPDAEAASSATLETHIGRMASRINSTHCSLGSEGPLHLISHVTPDELLALYSVADALLITPIRDGMNVVPFQYVVARNARRCLAAVVLSEFTGCARSLGGAVLVNPWDTQELANKIRYIIYEIEPEERRRNHDAMIQYVERFTSKRWSQRFLDQLREANEDESRSPCRELHREQIINAYLSCGQGLRVIILGLEGVIAPASTLPELLTLAPAEDAALAALCSNPNNAIVIVSTRSPEALEGLLGHLNCILVAESGWFIKWGRKSSWECQVPYLDTSWRDDVERVMEYYAERTPGSFIELKAHSVAWHFRDCDLGHGAWQAKQLQVSLTNLSRRLPFRVYSGNKMIEVAQQSPAPPEVLDILLDRLSPELPNTQTVTSTASVIPIITDPTAEEVAPPEAPKPGPEAATEPPPSVPGPIEDTLGFGALRSSTSLASMATSGTTQSGSTDVEFVLVILRGDDPTDEDIFEVLAPDPIDLDDFINEMNALDKADLVSLPSNRDSVMNPPTPITSSVVSPAPDAQASDERCQSPKTARVTQLLQKMSEANGAVARVVVPAPVDTTRSASTASVASSLVTSPIRSKADEEAEMQPGGPAAVPRAPVFDKAESRMRRASSTDLLSRARTEGTTSLASQPSASALYAIDETASVASASTGVQSHSALDRRTQIFTHKRFTPRTDFPPSALLFKAMKRKYGPHYSRYEIPDTAAACWALVRSMEKDGRSMERDTSDSDGGKSHKSMASGMLGGAASDESVFESVGGRRMDGGIEAAGTSKHFQLRSQMSLYDPLERRLSRTKMVATSSAGSFQESFDGRKNSAFITPPRRRRTIATSPSRSASRLDDASPVPDLLTLPAPVPLRSRMSAPTRGGNEVSEMAPPLAVRSISEGTGPTVPSRTASQGSLRDDGSLREPSLRPEESGGETAYARLSEDNVRSLTGTTRGGPPGGLAPAPDTDFVFPINTFSVVVGLKITQAHYFLKSKRAVGQLLTALAEPALNSGGPQANGLLSRTSSMSAVQPPPAPPQEALNEARIFVPTEDDRVVPLRDINDTRSPDAAPVDSGALGGGLP